MLVDSHAHLGDDVLYSQIDAVIERARQAGVGQIINICTNKLTVERGLEISKRYKEIYHVAATTPHDVAKEGEDNFSFFESLAREKRLVAIGEVGLDYHYEHSSKRLQQEFLVRYFVLAKKYSLPVVIHCREAFEDLFAIADKEYQGYPLLLHCFTGSTLEAKKALDRGWKISFSGIVTFKNSQLVREAALYTPLSEMMVETDSPYLAPASKRGQKNEPSFIVETAQYLADLKGVSFEFFSLTTCTTTQHFMNIEPRNLNG